MDLLFDLKLVMVLFMEFVLLYMLCKRSVFLVGWSLVFVDDISGDGLADLFVGVL